MALRDRFRTVVVVDTEFHGTDLGERPHVVALVASVSVEGHPERTLRYFEDELAACRRNPLPTGPDALWIAFVAQAEWRSLRSLGWQLPAWCIDLYVEARCLRNLTLAKGLQRRLKIRGNGLIDTCRAFGLAAADPLDKEAHRDLILSGGPWSDPERRKILDYCAQDVRMTADLWHRLRPIIPLDTAFYRGWFTQAIADMEDRGIPLDVAARDTLVSNLKALRRRLILQFDTFGLCGPDSDAIDPGRLVTLAAGRGIRWPTTPTGHPEMRLETLKRRLARHPDLHPIVALARGSPTFGDSATSRSLRMGGPGPRSGRSRPRRAGTCPAVVNSSSSSRDGSVA